jgi:hypothetical protein
VEVGGEKGEGRGRDTRSLASNQVGSEAQGLIHENSVGTYISFQKRFSFFLFMGDSELKVLSNEMDPAEIRFIL